MMLLVRDAMKKKIKQGEEEKLDHLLTLYAKIHSK